MPGCKVCPFRDDPAIVGAGLATGHGGLCDLQDPDSGKSSYEADVAYRSITARVNGVDYGSIPAPGAPMRPVVTSPVPAPPFVPIADDEAHGRVYGAARECPHRVESKSCCSPDRCGPAGEHAGEAISIGVCYPCSARRLGIRIEGA